MKNLKRKVNENGKKVNGNERNKKKFKGYLMKKQIKDF